LQSGLGNDPQASGNVQAAINQYFGLSAPGQTGLTSSSSSTGGSGGGIMDMLKMPGQSGGGIPGMAPGGGGMQGWIQQQLQNNNFQGLGG
jgi:hypothetical protein